VGNPSEAGLAQRVLGRALLVVFGIAIGVGVIAAAEWTLRVLDVGGGPRVFGPAVNADGTRILRLQWNPQFRRPQPPQPQRDFPAEKAPGTYRIFVVGESSAEGVPYGASLAFSSWLAHRLEAEAPEARWEVVNAALAGAQSWSVLSIVRDIARHQPDLLVVYLGHNEIGTRFSARARWALAPTRLWLRARLGDLRLYRVLVSLLPAQTQRRLRIDPNDMDQPEEEFTLTRPDRGRVYATAADRKLAAALYRERVEEIVRVMRAVGARTMLLTLSQNFSDFPPVVSAHRPGMRSDEKASWRTAVRQGDLLAPHDCGAALAAWARAEAIDDGVASLQFKMAGCERALGRLDAARARYRIASDLDLLSQGAPTQLNDVLREVAGQEGATLVDVDAAFTAASGTHLVGDDLFVDSHHPNVRGHQLIAAAVAEAIRAQGVPVPAARWRPDAYVDPDREALVAADPEIAAKEDFCRALSCIVAGRTCAIQALEDVRRATRDPATRKAAGDALDAFRRYQATHG
jgi:lysophospholipase L1-like esterase